MNLAMGLFGGGLQGVTSTIGNLVSGIGQGISGIGQPQQTVQRLQQPPASSGSNTMLYIGGISVVVVLGLVVFVISKKRRGQT